MSPTLYCCATRARMRSHVLLLPTTGISLSFLVGPGPLHEIAVSAFSRSPFRRADTFSFQYLPSTPRIYFKRFSSFTSFLSATSLSLSSVTSVTSVLYPPKFSIDSTSAYSWSPPKSYPKNPPKFSMDSTSAYSWSPPKSFHIFSTTLSHHIRLFHYY